MAGNQRPEGGDHSLRQHEAEVSRVQRDSPPRPNPNLSAPTGLGTDRRVHRRQVFRGEIQAQTTVSVGEKGMSETDRDRER